MPGVTLAGLKPALDKMLERIGFEPSTLDGEGADQELKARNLAVMKSEVPATVRTIAGPMLADAWVVMLWKQYPGDRETPPDADCEMVWEGANPWEAITNVVLGEVRLLCDDTLVGLFEEGNDL